MKRLSGERIAELAARPRVRAIAVENFLGTTPERLEPWEAIANLEQYARLYQWNAETQAAIRQGIKEMSR